MTAHLGHFFHQHCQNTAPVTRDRRARVCCKQNANAWGEFVRHTAHVCRVESWKFELPKVRDKIWEKASFDKRTLSRVFANEIQYNSCPCILAGGSGARESRWLEKQQSRIRYSLLLDIVCMGIPCWCKKTE
jgi:hypothetical protein